MRWFEKKPVDRDAEQLTQSPRIVTRFLWKPLRIGDETRWLEVVSIKQEYRFISTSRSFSSYGNREGFYYWKDLNWIDQTSLPL